MNEPVDDVPQVPPIIRRVVVHAGVEHAFRVLTERAASWWPLDVDTLKASERGADVTVEGNPGGRVVEKREDGSEATWAEVLVWEPAQRLVASWRPRGEQQAPTEVEFRFAEERPGLTRVAIEHRGWERLGDEADERHAAAETAWDVVLLAFERAANDPEVHRAFATSLQHQVRAALSSPGRAPLDDERMIDAARAARWHAAQVGLVSARDSWLVACAEAGAGRGEEARRQAGHALAAADSTDDAVSRVYAADAMARAAAAGGQHDEAAAWQARAATSLELVSDDQRDAVADDLRLGT